MMRLATAMDEIAPLRDPRVRANDAYLAVMLLARVITRLGSLPAVSTHVIERLFSADMAFLQDMYRRLNDAEANRIGVDCPACQHHFEAEVVPLGE
jgi:phage FluMu protein gp41